MTIFINQFGNTIFTCIKSPPIQILNLNLKYVRSSTNFVFFESKKHIDKLSVEMLEKGVRVGRPFPPFYDWCRISTGTSEEVDRFIESMLEVYS